MLERNGHTEATVDLMRLAGLKAVRPVLRDHAGRRHHDAGLRAAQKWPQEWGLKFITIRDLQDYRKRHEILVDRVDRDQDAHQVR